MAKLEEQLADGSRLDATIGPNLKELGHGE